MAYIHKSCDFQGCSFLVLMFPMLPHSQFKAVAFHIPRNCMILKIFVMNGGYQNHYFINPSNTRHETF